MAMKMKSYKFPKKNIIYIWKMDDSPMYIKDNQGRISKMGFLWWKLKG